jgi:small subunit ribosomal protein S16
VDRDKRFEGIFVVTVKLRLVRMGKKKQPTYRIVAAESRRARSGAFLEIVGTYQPRGLSAAEPETVTKIDNDKVLRWLHQGAQPTERVAKLLKTSGALEMFDAAKAEKSAAKAAEKAAK